MHIIFGLIIAAVGAVMVVKSEAMLSAFGRMDFFEKYLGTDGGSRLGYKLIGIAITMIGFMVMTDMFTSFLETLLWPILRLGRQ
jgi:hypothetical protein